MNTNSQIAVLVSSNHPVFLDGVRLMLGADPAVKVAGEARSLSEAASKVDQLHPDILLLDIAAEQDSAPASIRHMKKADPSLTILVLCLSGTPASPREVLEQAGALTFIQPHMGMQEVLRIIHSSDAAQRSARGREMQMAETHSPDARRETRKIA